MSEITSEMQSATEGFVGGKWQTEINVRDFIQKNYTLYEGDASFLAGPTEATKKLWEMCCELTKKEREKGGVLDMDTKVVSSIVSHGAGYLDKNLETIVGFQTDAPFKRSLQPFGGIRMAETSCKSYGYEVDPEISEIFTKYRKTHNQGVFDVYTPEMKAARHSGIITGLPDAYGRGRIIGDYRRVALYGIDRLIQDKQEQFKSLEGEMTPERIQLREEIAEQIRALKEMIELGKIYGFDISKPARTAKEAIQWLYFGYLSAVKEQNGAAMSLGRTSTFLDIYIERDLKNPLVLVPPKVNCEAFTWVVVLSAFIYMLPFITIFASCPLILGVRQSPPAPVSMFPIYTFPFIVGLSPAVYMKNLSGSGITRFFIVRSLTSIKP